MSRFFHSLTRPPAFFPAGNRHSSPLVALAALLLLLHGSAGAQVVNPVPPQQNTNSQSNNNNSGNGNGGTDPLMPMFDPGSEIISWNGGNWNIHDNRMFRARFEKYLNAPAATEEHDQAYRDTISEILHTLAPTHPGGPDVDAAFQLLPRASNYPIDANLCDSLANAIFNVWLAQRQQRRLQNANDSLSEEAKVLSRSAAVVLERAPVGGPTRTSSEAQKQWAENEQMAREMRVVHYSKRLAEIDAMRTANATKREVSELQAKLQFQGLMLQFFLQRRFEHVIMASRFYTLIFGRGDQMLDLEDGSDLKKAFSEGMGMPPTVGMMESLANEAIRDVDEGVQSFLFLLEQNEMRSASERLAEAFMVGEYLPKIRTLPREKKRQVVDFTQKSYQLISALDVKDYTMAENLVNELREIAQDFDPSKPLAAIETARSVAAMHLAKAKNAAVAGDHETVEKELRQATEIWPRNPALAEVSDLIFTQADSRNQALVDLDALISQKNFRQIYNDQLRFIAATANDPERSGQLQGILLDMQKIEGAIMRAQEMARRGEHRGAWEAIQRTYEQFPNDNKLNQLRADLTTKASDFVRILETAKEMEDRKQVGSALGWYLKAQNIYPYSDYARDGIHRLSQEIMPDSSRETDQEPGPAEAGSILSLN
jgi:ribosomal protein L18